MKYLIPIILALFSANLFAQDASVVSRNANLRESPSINAPVVKVIQRGTKLELTEKKGDWYFVDSDEYTGWVHSVTIRFTEKRKQKPKATDKEETDKSPIKAVFVGELENPRLTVQNNSNRNIELDLGGAIYEIKAGAERTIDLSLGSFEYTVTAKGLAPIKGVKRFENKHAYSWSFSVDGEY